MAAADTPLMQQWREIKRRHADTLLLFRVGDFYEMFNEDAEEGARLLDLTLTSRNNGSSRAPLAGIPAQALDGYVQRLVRLGRRVAICEQVEDPAQAKGIVRREVTETVTPGTVLSDSLLQARRNNFIAAVAGAPGDELLGLAWADLTTGELWTRAVAGGGLGDALGRIEPAEILYPRGWQLFSPAAAPGVVVTYRADWAFDPEAAAEELVRRYEVLSLDGYGVTPADAAPIGACGALVEYLAETQPSASAALRPPRLVRDGDAIPLDEMTRCNLELVEPLAGPGGPTLLSVLDEALTPMGARMLRRWVLSPLADVGAIHLRQEAIAELVDDGERRRALRAALDGTRDLERLAGKLAGSRATPRDLLATDESLARIPALAEALGHALSALVTEHRDALDAIPELSSLVREALEPDAPALLSEGGVIRTGFDPTLDELRGVRDGAIDWIARHQTEQRARTGISSLKVGYNRVFGYFIEVTRSNADRVPEDYQRKQTLANAERYVTPELKEWEARVLGAEERIAELEGRLFQEVRGTAARLVPRLQALADRVAALDVLSALAEVAVQREYCRPVVDDGFEIDIRAGRHPVVETMMPRADFIPNDVHLEEGARILVLTGPNMAGKSTVLRQVGLIVLLAQIGAFVPARSARIGRVDRIFTRVGASDNLVRGQSTFMVEMTETAAILNGATDRSLVLLDEIGRGTSTWDGLSVATAVTEYLHDRIGAKTIFATHYHELTRLADRLDGIVNFSVAVREEGERILFLRSLVAGGADRSYGVEVARLAGLPPEVIGRARSLLAELEESSASGARGNRAVRRATDPSQLGLFAGSPHPVVERLRAVDPNRLSPMDALLLLAELVGEARS